MANITTAQSEASAPLFQKLERKKIKKDIKKRDMRTPVWRLRKGRKKRTQPTMFFITQAPKYDQSSVTLFMKTLKSRH